MKVHTLVIATAAAAWPTLAQAQQADAEAGLGLLGAAPQKGTLAAPAPGPEPLAQPRTAGTDPKTAEPGEVTLRPPEVAEGPAAVGAVAPADGKAPQAEAQDAADAAQAQSAPGPAPGSTLADMVREAAEAAPDPAAAPAVAADPRPGVEIGAHTAQSAPAPTPAPDGTLAAGDLGAGTASDTGAPGEEFVRISREDSAAKVRAVSPEMLEALARAVLTPPAPATTAGSDFRAVALVTAPPPGTREEPREADLAAFLHATGHSDAVLEPAPRSAFAAPDLAYADVTDEVVSGEEAAVLAALAADPTAPFEEKAMTDPNQIACLEIMGAPFAGVPANDAEKAATRGRLAEAAGACVAASEGLRPVPEVMFYAGEVALARGDFAGAYGLYEQASAGGIGAADTRLADFFIYGAPPVTADTGRAAAYLEQGAGQGDPQAMTVLALMHGEGNAVPQNTARMVALLTEASEAGYHFAQYRLAQAYLDGTGVPGRSAPAQGIPDPAAAARWFTAAADGGNLDAALELAGLYADANSGLGENPDEQARLTQMVADAGLPAGKAALGVLYETGRGVPQTPARAAELYIEALASGEVSFEDLRNGAPYDWDYDTAVAFQDALAQRGVYDGASDGIVGRGTRRAAEALVGG